MARWFSLCSVTLPDELRFTATHPRHIPIGENKLAKEHSAAPPDVLFPVRSKTVTSRVSAPHLNEADRGSERLLHSQSCREALTRRW